MHKLWPLQPPPNMSRLQYAKEDRTARSRPCAVNLVNLVNFATVLDGPECPYANQRTDRTARRVRAPGAIAKWFPLWGGYCPMPG